MQHSAYYRPWHMTIVDLVVRKWLGQRLDNLCKVRLPALFRCRAFSCGGRSAYL